MELPKTEAKVLPTSLRRMGLLRAAVTCALLFVLLGCGEIDRPIDGAKEPTFATSWPTPASSSRGRSGPGTGGGGANIVRRVVRPDENVTLTTGRYSLAIPSGALYYTCIWGVVGTASGPIEVQLYPHGATFHNDVTMTIDLSGTSAEGQQNVWLYWYDDQHHSWVNVGGEWDPTTHQLVTPLHHFSRYRAGW